MLCLWMCGLLSFAHAAQGGEVGLLPHVMETADDVRFSWELENDWLVSPVRSWVDGGERVGALATVDLDVMLDVDVRAVDEAGFVGPWVPLEETWRGGDGQRVLVADLMAWTPAVQMRIRDLDGLEVLGFGLHLPPSEAIGEPAPPRPPAVSQMLEDIGVIPREDWGAAATTCTTLEDDWYRFAIHHTAGSQTTGGTIQGAVQATQAYAMSTEYCDIPYQFMVGYDGSLWEGRPYGYYSGATGGGNNDGNMAISFMGCYDADDCGDAGDEDTLVMIAAARLLAQTLAEQEDTVTTEDTLRGHQDWPDNSTACPGDRVAPRLDEIRSAAAHYQGTVVASAFDGGVTVGLGQVYNGWIQVRNDGLETWTSNTRLASLPRDEESELAVDSWLSSTRISAPDSDTAPGEVATFAVDVYGESLGGHTLSLALVEEWVTWFGDIPVGGGPADDAVVVSFWVDEQGDTGNPDYPDDTDDDTGEATQDGDTGRTGGVLPGRPVGFDEMSGGCGCAQGHVTRGSLLLLLATCGLGLRRRR